MDCPPDSSRLIEIPPLVDLEEEIQLCQDVLHFKLDGRLDAFHLGEDTGWSNTEPVSVEGGPRCTLHRQDGRSQPARAEAHAYNTAAHPYHMAHMLLRGKQVFLWTMDDEPQDHVMTQVLQWMCTLGKHRWFAFSNWTIVGLVIGALHLHSHWPLCVVLDYRFIWQVTVLWYLDDDLM